MSCSCQVQATTAVECEPVGLFHRGLEREVNKLEVRNPGRLDHCKYVGLPCRKTKHT